MKPVFRMVVIAVGALTFGAAHASVDLTDRGAMAKRLAKAGDKKPNAQRPATPAATGSLSLIDSTGLKYFINTNVTFATSSSASAAASEASYTHAVNATTLNGGTVSSTLNDMFDGYGSICLSQTATGPCATGDANYAIYNQTGAAPTADAACAGNRQYVFPNQTLLGSVRTSRTVYVPTNDNFIRWINTFTNTGAMPITFRMITSNNLGSDSNTQIVTTSSGDATVTTADQWVTSFQAYSGTTSSDPRVAHVLQGAGATIPVSAINFVNGDDNPFWSYSITLQPGQTTSIMNFAAGTPSKAAAAAQAARLTSLPATAVACLATAQLAQVANFAVQAPVPTQVPTGSRTALAVLMIGIALSALAIARRRREAA